MSYHNGPRIVTDGLVLCLDAGNPKSYPGAGAVWKDLGGNGLNGSINGPTFNTMNGGSLVFDNIDDYVNCGNSSLLNPTSNFSISVWLNANSGGETSFGGNIFSRTSSIQDGYWMTITNTNRIAFYGQNATWGTNVGFTIPNSITYGKWDYFTCVAGTDYVSDLIYAYIYKNGIKLNTQNYIAKPPTASENAFIGNNLDQTLTFDGKIAQILFHNRELSDLEIKQNYNATKGRFGL